MIRRDYFVETRHAASPDATSPNIASPDTASPDTASPDTASPDASHLMLILLVPCFVPKDNFSTFKPGS